MPSINFFDNTTTAASAAVAPTASNNITTSSADGSNDWVATVLPVLTVMALIAFLLRLCYKALRDDDQDKPRDHYSLQV